MVLHVLISVKSMYFCKHEDINLAHECTIECFRLWVLSKARTRCDDMTKDQPSNNLISLFNMQILNFPLCLVTVEPGISI